MTQVNSVQICWLSNFLCSLKYYDVMKKSNKDSKNEKERLLFS